MIGLPLALVGLESARRSSHLIEHFEHMEPWAELGLLLLVLLPPAGTIFLALFDRLQVSRTLRHLALEEGERVVALCPAYLGPPRPVLMRLRTFGEFLVITERRLLHLKWGFLGVRSTQRCLLEPGQRAALARGDLAAERGPLHAAILRRLSLQWFLTLVPVGQVEALHIVPEVASYDSLVEQLRESGSVVEAAGPEA